MNPSNEYLLTVNAGSSSIKLAVFATDDPLKKLFEAAVANIGQASASLVADNQTKTIDAKDHAAAADVLLEWLAAQIPVEHVAAIGHRIVHGGPKYHESQFATHEVLADLQELKAFDPRHLPVELALVTTFQHVLPDAKQVLCFDTAFHHDLPMHSRLLPIPRHFETKGIRRYGFHGLSYAYILEGLRRVEGEPAANGKVIIAHLGSGASLTALQNGKPIDTTMSVTPASGVPMSTRAGDLDPGLALYFAQTQGYDAERFNHMVNFESGLLGISETTADMKKLLEIEDNDERAKDAVDIFCYQVKKSIGSFAAALSGLNTLVFTGGMGENAPKIRSRICEGLEFLGITIDDTRNQQGNRLISADGSQVGVHVIHTDEATTIARETARLISKTRGGHGSN
ncbi:MAG TPA: acetate/propionate family kinase [Magnetospirillaceae bacterium]|nr:acetate/propionate family kinase [Magnetospirillaceae bacterium]